MFTKIILHVFVLRELAFLPQYKLFYSLYVDFSFFHVYYFIILENLKFKLFECIYLYCNYIYSTCTLE